LPAKYVKIHRIRLGFVPQRVRALSVLLVLFAFSYGKMKIHYQPFSVTQPKVKKWRSFYAKINGEYTKKTIYVLDKRLLWEYNEKTAKRDSYMTEEE
jgi:hypothetical protein